MTDMILSGNNTIIERDGLCVNLLSLHVHTSPTADYYYAYTKAYKHVQKLCMGVHNRRAIYIISETCACIIIVTIIYVSGCSRKLNCLWCVYAPDVHECCSRVTQLLLASETELDHAHFSTMPIY